MCELQLPGLLKAQFAEGSLRVMLSREDLSQQFEDESHRADSCL